MKGQAFKFGDNISTDHIAPGRLFHLRNDLVEFSKHVLEDADPEFASQVQNGDFVTMDFGAVYNGYHSDMTRTVAVGEPTEKQKEIYSVVLKAQKAALSVLKAGVPCSEADKAARDVIEAAGYKEFFGHGTGHGVGIEIHEAPTLSPRSKADLGEGNVVTIEPGIYIPNEFGVRIEDMALITKDGFVNLTSCEKELIIL